MPGQPLPCGYANEDKDGTVLVGWSIAGLCSLVSTQWHLPVVDKTGLTGLFDFHLDFFVGPPGAPEYDDQRGLAMDALRKLGRRAEPAQSAAEIIVVDSIERPSEINESASKIRSAGEVGLRGNGSDYDIQRLPAAVFPTGKADYNRRA